MKLIKSLVASTLLACAAHAADFYISPQGGDNNKGTLESPFQSLEKARDAVRELNKKGQEESHNIFLRGGTYQRSETFVLGLEDSAAPGFTHTYQAYKNESPILSAGKPVNDWKKLNDYPAGTLEVAKGHLWVADIPVGIEDFKVLFDGNFRLERARSRGFQGPQQNFKKFATRNVALKEDRPLLRRLEFPGTEIKNWDNLGDVEAFFCGVPWTQNISSIEKVEGQVAWLKYEGNTPPSTTPKPYNPTRIENIIDVLDTPGEWCVNTKTRKIYYWPKSGAPSQEIVAPALKEIIKIEGKINYEEATDEPVKNIHLKGLTFTHGDRYSWWDDHKGWGIQHDWDKFDNANAMLRFRGAEDCSVSESRFTNSGNSAIRLDLHAQNITVKNNLIDYVGHMGILLCGYGPGTKDVNKNNIIENNLIDHCGEVIWHGHAIFVWQSGSNKIRHNHIRNVPRKAIGLCGIRGAIFDEGPEVDWDEASKTMRWKEIKEKEFKGNKIQDMTLPYLHSRNNLVENNYVYRARTKIGDGAALNVSGAGTGNIIRRNMLYMCLGNGLRCDDWQRGTTYSENLVLSGGMVHKGNNDVINNMFINTNIRFSLYPGQQLNAGSEVKNNLFYHTRENIAPYTGRSSNTIKTPESCDLQNNSYFATQGLDKIEAHVKLWKVKNQEKGSVIADPIFAKPLDFNREIKATDLKLSDDSPAYKAGFKAIDLEAIGLQDGFPAHWLEEVFPSKRGVLVSKGSEISYSSIRSKDIDLERIVNSDEEPSVPTIFESKPEASPWFQIKLKKAEMINGLHLIANAKDRQNAMRGLTVWTSLDGKKWQEIWQADPYHIAMAREWHINPKLIQKAQFVKIGLKEQASLQMSAKDDRIKSMRAPALSLKQVKVFAL
ncbi:right-handed parallel beta-helix repeat-containing protein [Lentisphaera profundi]|uniref:Right-handed parallel beta-helix repeat-containing protein n=1 Tax=Lentisphaera profundi TaxID=1658616 RepID=A0ABY7VUR3_9BACT|nr:right-handed parallel beta-helix repeat-containing protein [Lentisphaera profundi]WDE96566.1 right-handed parallel beta-helix repeat-containing protein [Lentisphaera profundi]